MFRRVGPGADNAHLPGEHVQKLGQFIDARLSNNAADFGDAWIVSAREVGADRWRILSHAAKFVNRERLAASSHSRLAKERSARAGCGNCDRSDDENGAENHQRDRRDEDVQNALQAVVPAARRSDFITWATFALAVPTRGNSAPEGRSPFRLRSITPGSSASE